MRPGSGPRQDCVTKIAMAGFEVASTRPAALQRGSGAFAMILNKDASPAQVVRLM